MTSRSWMLTAPFPSPLRSFSQLAVHPNSPSRISISETEMMPSSFKSRGHAQDSYSQKPSKRNQRKSVELIVNTNPNTKQKTQAQTQTQTQTQTQARAQAQNSQVPRTRNHSWIGLLPHDICHAAERGGGTHDMIKLPPRNC